MRSTLAKDGPVETRRAWEAPAMSEVSIGRATKAAAPDHRPDEGGNPPPPASPGTKLGFSFEMSFPLSARTDI
jgi:hypothetical protein